MAQLRDLGLEATDEAIQLTVTIAAAYFEAGDVRQAVRLCREAVDRAEQLGSARAKASAYWNASILESEAGQVTSAISLAEHALALLERDEDMRSLSRLESQLGMFLLRLQPPDVEAARVHLDLAGAGSTGHRRRLSRSPSTTPALARAHLLAGEYEEARALLLTTLSATGDSAPLLMPRSWSCSGRSRACPATCPPRGTTTSRAILVLTGIKADRARRPTVARARDPAGSDRTDRRGARRLPPSSRLHRSQRPPVAVPAHAYRREDPSTCPRQRAPVHHIMAHPVDRRTADRMADGAATGVSRPSRKFGGGPELVSSTTAGQRRQGWR